MPSGFQKIASSRPSGPSKKKFRDSCPILFPTAGTQHGATTTTIVNFCGIEKSEWNRKRTQNRKANCCVLQTATCNSATSGSLSTRTTINNDSVTPSHGDVATLSNDTTRNSPRAYSRLLRNFSPSTEQSTVIVSSNQGMRSVRTRTGTTKGRRTVRRRSTSRSGTIAWAGTACLRESISNRNASSVANSFARATSAAFRGSRGFRSLSRAVSEISRAAATAAASVADGDRNTPAPWSR